MVRGEAPPLRHRVERSDIRHFIIDPKFPDGFWRRKPHGNWAFQSFLRNVGMAKPEVAHQAVAALTAEPLTALDFQAGGDKELFKRAIHKAKQAQRRLRVEAAQPLFFRADLLRDVGPPCDLCGGISVCDCSIPRTLTAVFSAPSCADLDGITLPLTYEEVISGTYYWRATFSPGGGCGELTFEFAILSGIACETAQVIYNEGGGEAWGNSAGTGVLTCPFESDTYTAGIPACMSSMTCVGDLTVTVS